MYTNSESEMKDVQNERPTYTIFQDMRIYFTSQNSEIPWKSTTKSRKTDIVLEIIFIDIYLEPRDSYLQTNKEIFEKFWAKNQ